MLTKNLQSKGKHVRRQNDISHLIRESCCHAMIVSLSLHNFYAISCAGKDPTAVKKIPQCKDYSDKFWLCPWIFGHCLPNVISGLPFGDVNVSTGLAGWSSINLFVKRPTLQWWVISSIENLRLFQECRHARRWRHILQNRAKIHLPYALVYLDKAWYCNNCWCVCLAQHDSTLKTTRSTFTNNNATWDGGAIYALVGHHIQGLIVLENRIW